MATRVLSGFCILFLLLSAIHVLPSTEAVRILDEDKAAGAGSTRYNALNPNNPLNRNKPQPHGGSGRPYPLRPDKPSGPYNRPCNNKYHGCPP